MYLPDSMIILDSVIPPFYLKRLREEAGRIDHKNSDKMPLGCFLDKRNVYMLCERFQRVRRLDRNGWLEASIYPDPLREGEYHKSLLVRDGEDAHLAKYQTYLDLERATRLVELDYLLMSDFLTADLPDRLFPDMRRLKLRAGRARGGGTLEELETVFEECARVCPSLEFLTLWISEDRRGIAALPGTWKLVDSYSVFAHVPPTLKVLVIALDEVEPPSLACTTSAFVQLIQRHLPAHVQVHLIASPRHAPGCRPLVDEKQLPRAPWASDVFPVVGERYSDAALAPQL